jgi:hypothetical protein
MQHFILQILTPQLLLHDFVERSYKHLNGEWSDFKSCNSPYTANSALISGCVFNVVHALLFAPFSFKFKPLCVPHG